MRVWNDDVWVETGYVFTAEDGPPLHADHVQASRRQHDEQPCGGRETHCLQEVYLAGSTGVTPVYADLESALILPIDPPRHSQG